MRICFARKADILDWYGQDICYMILMKNIKRHKFLIVKDNTFKRKDLDQ